MISYPMGQDRTNPESGESVIDIKDETLINNEWPAIILAPSLIPRENSCNVRDRFNKYKKWYQHKRHTFRNEDSEELNTIMCKIYDSVCSDYSYTKKDVK
jgi:hypothetical protein